MPMNYFLGRSQDWLEKQLRLQQQNLALGKTTTAVGAGDTHSGSAVQIGTVECIRMILAALSILDPATYPPEQVTPVTETRVTFRSYGDRSA